MNGQKVSTGTTPIKENRSRIKKVNGFDDEQNNSGIEQSESRARRILEILLPDTDNHGYNISELMLLLKTFSILEPAMISEKDADIIAKVKEVISEFLYCAFYHYIREEE